MVNLWQSHCLGPGCPVVPVNSVSTHVQTPIKWRLTCKRVALASSKRSVACGSYLSQKQRRSQFQRKCRLKICLCVIVIFPRQFYPFPLNDDGEMNSSQLLIEWNHQHLFLYSLFLTISRSLSVPCLCSNCIVFFAWMACNFRCLCSNLWKLPFLLLTFFLLSFFPFLSFFSVSPFFLSVQTDAWYLFGIYSRISTRVQKWVNCCNLHYPTI